MEISNTVRRNLNGKILIKSPYQYKIIHNVSQFEFFHKRYSKTQIKLDYGMSKIAHSDVRPKTIDELFDVLNTPTYRPCELILKIKNTLMKPIKVSLMIYSADFSEYEDIDNHIPTYVSILNNFNDGDIQIILDDVPSDLEKYLCTNIRWNDQSKFDDEIHHSIFKL